MKSSLATVSKVRFIHCFLQLAQLVYCLYWILLSMMNTGPGAGHRIHSWKLCSKTWIKAKQHYFRMEINFRLIQLKRTCVKLFQLKNWAWPHVRHWTPGHWHVKAPRHLHWARPSKKNKNKNGAALTFELIWQLSAVVLFTVWLNFEQEPSNGAFCPWILRISEQVYQAQASSPSKDLNPISSIILLL